MSITNSDQHRLAAFIIRFEEANAAHDHADAARERATSLDLALEREAAEHGIEFSEIVQAWRRSAD